MWEEHGGTCLNICHVGVEADAVGYQREVIASLWCSRVRAAEEHKETASAISRFLGVLRLNPSVLRCAFGRTSKRED